MNLENIRKVLANLNEMGLNQMLITDPLAIAYLTDYKNNPMERFMGLLLKTDGSHVFFMNNLFPEPGFDMTIMHHGDGDDVMKDVAACCIKGEKLGVDKDLKARFLLPLMDLGAASGYVNASLAVDMARAIKTDDEQQKMITASAINDAAMAQFVGLIHEGVTEKEVSDKMLAIYKDLGADGFSFTPIVAFGANAANPHHETDDTVIKEGDCIIFDVGCIKDGYCSDMTRTFFYKSVSDHARQVYELVRRANEAAEALISPDVPLCKLDRAARDVIAGAGYGPYFNHRLGHFSGRSEHEYGDVSEKSDLIAAPGMCFSIEPGIYLEGEVGVRIEDLALVTPEGVKLLNTYPKELQIIG